MDFKSARSLVEARGLRLVQDRKNGLAAVAVGASDRGPIDKATDFCVRGFVPQRLSRREIRAKGVRPFRAAVEMGRSEDFEADVHLDVVECGRQFRPLAGGGVHEGLYGGNPPVLNAQKWFATLRCGIGVANPEPSYPTLLSVGTAGFYMQDENGATYLVSNNHVIGRSNQAKKGEPIVQPGSLDFSGEQLRRFNTTGLLRGSLDIAEFLAFVPITFPSPGDPAPNEVDAAIARLIDSGRVVTELDRLCFGGSILSVADPYEVSEDGEPTGDARVYKVGRTTGYTEGVVTNILATAEVPYGGIDASFHRQIVVEATADNVGPFSDEGDSGSAVLNRKHEIVGMLFAGTDTYTLVNPIDPIVNSLRSETGNPDLKVITA